MKYNSVDTYYKELMNIPIYDDTIIDNLFKKYCYGDYNAKNEIINRSMHLVYEIALKYQKYLYPEDFQEIIAIGNSKIMKTVETYGLNQVSFREYATKIIEEEMVKYLHNQKQYLKISSDVSNLVDKYHEIISRSGNGKKCSLDYISAMLELNIDGDLVADIDTLHRIIYKDEKQYNNCYSQKILIVLKNTLSNLEYYILYNYLCSNKKLSIKEMSLKLNITEDCCCDNLNSALKKMSKCLDEAFMTQKIDEIRFIFKDTTNLKIEPFSIIKICAYNYLKKYLSSLELQLLYLYLFDVNRYYDEDYILMFKLSKEEYKRIVLELCKKIELYVIKDYHFITYMKGIIYFYGEHLFEVDINKDLIDYAYLEHKFFSLSYDDFVDMYSNKLAKLDIDNVILINKYYNFKIMEKALHTFNDLKNIIKKRFNISINMDTEKSIIINIMQKYAVHIYDLKYSLMFYYGIVESDLLTSKERFIVFESLAILDKDEPVILKKSNKD